MNKILRQFVIFTIVFSQILTPLSGYATTDTAAIPMTSIPSLPSQSDETAQNGVYALNVKDSEQEDNASSDTCCDWRFVGTIFDYRPFNCCPMTKEKATYLAAAGAFVGACVALQLTVGLLDPIKNILAAPNSYVTAALWGFEPLNVLLNAAFAKYPKRYQAPPIDEETQQAPVPAKGAESLGIVVVCHNSTNEIEATIHALLQHVRGDQIFVVDNANSPTPTDDTREKVLNIDPTINYTWLPIGSKLIAQYTGCRAAATKDLKHMLTIDDDVQLPKDFHFATELLDEYTKGIAYPIRAIHPDGEDKNSLFIDWQDIEYKLSDLMKLTQSEYTTVLHPHGSVSLWERETFEKVLRKHDAVFFYDDVQIGMITKDMGKRIGMCGDSFVNTVAPSTPFGTMPNLYNQRVRLWDTGRHGFTGKFIYSLICHWDGSEFQSAPQGVKDCCKKVLKTIAGNTVLKANGLYTVYALFADIARVPVLIFYAPYPQFWAELAGYTVGMTIPIAIWNYGKLHDRPDLKSNLKSISTFCGYQFFTSFLSSLGALRVYTLYYFNKKHVETVPELEERNDPRAIWNRDPQYTQ